MAHARQRGRAAGVPDNVEFATKLTHTPADAHGHRAGTHAPLAHRPGQFVRDTPPQQPERPRSRAASDRRGATSGRPLLRMGGSLEEMKVWLIRLRMAR